MDEKCPISLGLGFVVLCLIAAGCTTREEGAQEPAAVEPAAAKAAQGAKEAQAIAAQKIEEGKKVAEPQKKPAAKAVQPGEEHVVLTTDLGDIVIDVFEQDAPKHSENIKKLARAGFYDGLTFHRVIDGFMAQGGDPQGTGSGGPGYTIPGEFTRKHVRGSVAAARLGDEVNPKRDSSGSQFYICFRPQPELDRLGYSVFGQVVKGMEVVDRITKGDPRSGHVPPERRTKILKAKVVPASEVKL